MKKLIDLPWESRFVEHFPGDRESRNFIRQVRKALYSEVKPTPVASPKLIGWASDFAESLGIVKPSADDLASVEMLAGNRLLPGMRPYAARYGGHQFGQWAGQLGDGRAITLGEATFPTAGRLEFQLKGPGQTPYSRHADGRAVLRSSLREFACSEAMHFLGVPTTRALSLVTTGDEVIRDMFYDGNPVPEPGAIVCRVAPTFLRFGNFEILAAYEENDLLKQLADYIIRDFYPQFDSTDPDVYGQLMDEVCRRTALMIVHWQRVGFVHGVMNTDNMSMLGLTIDYGPYGWLEPYDPNWTPNTTDAGTRRYKFGNQPGIALWNLSCLGSALFPLIKVEDRIHQSLELFRTTFQDAHDEMRARKLGLSSVDSEEDQKLVTDLYELLQKSEADYTLFFRNLSSWQVKSEPAETRAQTFLQLLTPTVYVDELQPALRDRWVEWSRRYVSRVQADEATDEARTLAMQRVNPKYVLRNYMAQNAINAAEQGDLSVLERLMRVLRRPYDEQPEEQDLYAKRPDWARNAPGCSALSCSS